MNAHIENEYSFMGKEWKWFTVDLYDILYGNFWFMSTFQAVIRQHGIYPNKEVVVKLKDGNQYKFIFDWQEENICGIEVYVYKKIPEPQLTLIEK
jgi:hypothetical protein